MKVLKSPVGCVTDYQGGGPGILVIRYGFVVLTTRHLMLDFA